MDPKVLLDELVALAKGRLGDKWPGDAVEVNKQLLELSADTVTIAQAVNDGEMTDEAAARLFEAQKNRALTVASLALGLVEMEAQSLVNAWLVIIIRHITGAAGWIVPL